MKELNGFWMAALPCLFVVAGLVLGGLRKGSVLPGGSLRPSARLFRSLMVFGLSYEGQTGRVGHVLPHRCQNS